MVEPENVVPAAPCPICGKPGRHAVRPFCSKRCADIDLHHWLSGLYVVPAAEEHESDDDVTDAPDANAGQAGRA